MIRGLIGFLPWIVYAFVATSDEWRWGAIVGLACAIVIVIIERTGGKTWDQAIIALSAVGFFAVITVYSLIQPDSSLTMYGPALVNVWLGITAWGSLAIRKPFTMGMAKAMAPKEMWDTPGFYKVNAIITTAWAVAFTVAAISLTWVLAVDQHATALVITIKVATFVAPALFTARYTRMAKARAQQISQ
ncbi:hypothetical protein ACIBG8_46185 [Nonomuraea sp. NPDC050556]|uniref:hypothetical protein n=1 Tax=Nonomuraea sp. NPDC050556 TaxID=3364369 RepID=UPI00378D55D6